MTCDVTTDYRVEILQGWCTARTTHCGSGYDVTMAAYSLADVYQSEKWRRHNVDTKMEHIRGRFLYRTETSCSCYTHHNLW